MALSPFMGKYGCNDEHRAKDILRTHVCEFFDHLKNAYSNKIFVWEYEREIAEEAVQITCSCWRTFNVALPDTRWIDMLRKAIVQHLGRPLRGPLQKVSIPAAYAAAGIDIDSASPLLKLAMAQGAQQQVFAPVPSQMVAPLPKSTLSEELHHLLLEARWKPEDIAEKIGIVPRNVYRHLSGETSPTLSNLGSYEAALSKHLGRKVKLPLPAKRQNVSKTSAKRQ